LNGSFDAQVRSAAVAAMLEAQSVALVGASNRPGSLGQRMVGEVLRSPGAQKVWLVNPGSPEVAGRPCLPSLAEINQAPDLVLLGVGDQRLVEQLSAAAAVGARGAVVFGSAHAAGVREELTRIATEAGMALVGAGCMGFWNVRHGLRAMGYTERDDLPVGPISVVTHSGSVFSTLLRTRLRLGYDLVVSSGQELVTNTADYVEHVVAHTDTRVLALVVETVRDGDRLRAGLRAARENGIEVVLLPVGGSPLGSSLVAAHSGAVAGDAAGWEALADDLAAHLVGDLAELGDTLAVLSSSRRPTAPGGGIATVHDSGAERSLVADLAHSVGVPFASLSEASLAALGDRLEEGLEPGNPLDVWGGGADTRGLFGDCLTTIAADPSVGVTALAIDLVHEYDGDIAYPEAVEDAVAATASSGAPLVVLTGLPGAIDPVAAERLRAIGVPVLEGFRSGLLALRHLLDAVERPRVDEVDLAVDTARQQRWRDRLLAGPLTPVELRALLADYDVPTPQVRAAASSAEALAAAEEVGWPVVLKTDAAGIEHRSDVGGVAIGLADGLAVAAAYADLAARLGPLVTVHAQVEAGVEISVGVVRDAALGPMVVVAAGGVLVELMADRAVGLPPLAPAGARRLLDRLRVRPLLDGWRGAPPAHVDALVDVVVAVSRLAHELRDVVAALDLNPVVVTPKTAVAVDALVVPLATETQEEPSWTA
jgi:acyl-CoA synthetase (NDP forming)